MEDAWQATSTGFGQRGYAVIADLLPAPLLGWLRDFADDLAARGPDPAAVARLAADLLARREPPIPAHYPFPTVVTDTFPGPAA